MLRLLCVILVVDPPLVQCPCPLQSGRLRLSIMYIIYAKFFVLIYCLISKEVPQFYINLPLHLCTSLLILFFCNFMLVSNKYHNHRNKSLYLYSLRVPVVYSAAIILGFLLPHFVNSVNSLFCKFFWLYKVGGRVWLVIAQRYVQNCCLTQLAKN